MPLIRLSAIYRYPVKSCAGHPVETIRFDAFGPEGDRRWMVTDPTGKFLTQRQWPRMALVRPEPAGDGLRLHAPGIAPLEVPFPRNAPLQPVTVWQSACQAADAGEGAASWLSDVLQTPCRLVAMHDAFRRAVNPEYARDGDQVGFADGFPLLLISQASLDDLNARLSAPLPMDRFRPNLVVSGCAPYAEDGWKRLRVGGMTLHSVKPCARCTVTTVDQATGQRDAEPLKTLATYRRTDDGRILFGQNLVHTPKTGRIEVGMAVEVEG